MKQTSRKKVLLSSVAMMMVATVSLGSATYAWFTNNTVVNANGMKVKASAAQGLQISIDNGSKWGATKTFEVGEQILYPVSTGYCSYNDEGVANEITNFQEKAFYPKTAEQEGKWSPEQTNAFKEWQEIGYPAAATNGEAQATNEYFMVYEVGVKSTGEALNNVNMVVRTTDEKKFMRVAILENGKTTTEVDGKQVTTNDTAVTFTEDTIVAVLGDESSPEAITSKTPESKGQKLTASTGADYTKSGVSVGTEAQYYTILVWYEGQDGECVDASQQAAGTIEVEFNIPQA